MRRRISYSLAVRIKIRTGRSSFAGRNHSHIRTVDVHRVDLIARASASRLKDQFLSVSREIRLGVLAAEAQLANVGEVFLLRQPKRIIGKRGRVSRCKGGQRDDKDYENRFHYSSGVSDKLQFVAVFREAAG